MPKIFPLPRQQMLVLAVFGGVSPDPKQAPSPSLFSLSLTLICVSPHIGKLLCASTGCFWQLGVLEHNVVSRWYWWKSNPPLFSRLAQVQPAVKSLGFLYSRWIRMVDCGYMCMIHEHTAAFSITDPTATRLFLPPRDRLYADEPPGKIRIVSLRCYSELFWPLFLWGLYIEIDSVEEVGWGKRLSRNPGNWKWWSSFTWQQFRLPFETFTIKLLTI